MARSDGAKVSPSRQSAHEDVIREILLDLDLEQVLQKVAQGVAEIINADCVRLWIYDPAMEKLQLRAFFGPGFSSTQVKEYRPAESFFGKSFLTGGSVIVGNVQTQEGFLDVDWAVQEGVFSALFKPISVGEWRGGVLSCFSREENFFGDSELETVQVFATDAAIAIRNAELHQEALETQNFFKSLFEGIDEAIVIVEPAGSTITHWNASAERLYGYSADEIIGKNIETLMPDDSTGEQYLRERGSVSSAGRSRKYETRRMAKGGRTIPVNLTLSPIFDLEGNMSAVVGIHFDLTRQKKIEEGLRNEREKFEVLATVDALTGLQNRRAFDEMLARETGRVRRHASRVCLLMMDIDHFKLVNDTHGHQTGDEVLSRTAGVVKKILRQTDIAARYGGEEFALILPDTPLEGALVFAERIHGLIPKEKYVGETGEAFRVTCSMGLAEYDPGTEDEAALIKRADTALYRAKETGRNRICTA